MSNANTQKTILVIEDEDALQEAIHIRLTSAGYNVVSTTTAERGLELLKTIKPDLVWLDLLLPGMGGLHFLEYVRNDELLKNLPILVVSASAGPEKIQRAFQLNILDFIIKSEYRIEDIVKKVDEFTGKV